MKHEITIAQGQTAYCIKRIGKTSKRTYITGICFDGAVAEAWLARCKAEMPNADWRIELANVALNPPTGA